MPVIDTVQLISETAPLMRFSPYTHGQVSTIVQLGNDIRALLDRSVQGSTVEHDGGFLRAYGYFWLWILGSYEVTRTMCQAKTCFSADFAEQVCGFKKRVSVLRMPFAKLELPGVKRPIVAEAAVHNVDVETKDIHFEVKGEILSARTFIADFERLASSVKPTDVIKSIYGQAYFSET